MHNACGIDQHGDGSEKIDAPQGVEICINRERIQLKAKAIGRHRHRDPAHEGRIHLSDQSHRVLGEPPSARPRNSTSPSSMGCWGH